MVLTGKQALDFSGGVSAEDNLGIGGFDRVMGPNGQAQYFARDLFAAAGILLAHYENSYVAPGERFPRRAQTDDPVDRDVRAFPHPHRRLRLRARRRHLRSETNPERKAALRHPHSDAGRHRRRPRAARTLARHGFRRHLRGVGRPHRRHRRHTPRIRVTPGAAAGIRAGRRSGQLDLGDPVSHVVEEDRASHQCRERPQAAGRPRPTCPASTVHPNRCAASSSSSVPRSARAVTNFDGPMVFCVVSRYHGGAFVVFSKALNESLEIAAVEGSRASVIGGAPAAAVVFTRDVDNRTDADERIVDLRSVEAADGSAVQELAPSCAPSVSRCVPRSSARCPTSSITPTASSGPRGWARSTTSSPEPICGPTSSAALERGMAHTSGDDRRAPPRHLLRSRRRGRTGSQPRWPAQLLGSVVVGGHAEPGASRRRVAHRRRTPCPTALRGFRAAQCLAARPMDRESGDLRMVG